MFLIRGMLVQFLEWWLDKLKGYTFTYHCMVDGCNFKGASTHENVIIQLAKVHDTYHREHS